MSVFKDEMCAASITLVKAIIHKILQPATNMVSYYCSDSDTWLFVCICGRIQLRLWMAWQWNFVLFLEYAIVLLKSLLSKY